MENDGKILATFMKPAIISKSLSFDLQKNSLHQCYLFGSKEVTYSVAKVAVEPSAVLYVSVSSWKLIGP